MWELSLHVKRNLTSRNNRPLEVKCENASAAAGRGSVPQTPLQRHGQSAVPQLTGWLVLTSLTHCSRSWAPVPLRRRLIPIGLSGQRPPWSYRILDTGITRTWERERGRGGIRGGRNTPESWIHAERHTDTYADAPSKCSDSRFESLLHESLSIFGDTADETQPNITFSVSTSKQVWQKTNSGRARQQFTLPAKATLPCCLLTRTLVFVNDHSTTSL